MTDAVGSASLQELRAALADARITSSAAENIRAWLTEPRYTEYASEVAEHISAGKWQQLDDVFWTVIPFGTGGRRGKMYPIGSGAINDRTIGESAQGLADYVKVTLAGDKSSTDDAVNLSCAIAYDTRHRSQHFARLCAEIMVAAGFTVYFLEPYRSTPQLSFAVRDKRCSCGIMITASHNPPSDNAVKVYWSNGGQILPPHDQGVIDRVMNTQQIDRVEFDDAVARDRIIFCSPEVDSSFQQAVLAQAAPGPRELNILYSPLHGVGATAVCPVLDGDGFARVELFAPHAEPDGDFPNVPGHVSNPENPEVFDAMIERAREIGADIAIATDPDCDRIGCAAPVSWDAADWQTLTGNQIGALLADFVLETRQSAGRLSPDHYVVKTLVTTELIRRIADSYGVRTVGELLVGFKWIAEAIDQLGPDRFVFAAEESHGYQAGTHVRDKDGAVAAMLLCELAASLRARQQTLHEKLDALMWQHGAHAERTVSIQMPGSEGMQRMKDVMANFRHDPPHQLGQLTTARVRDYLEQTARRPGIQPDSLPGPRGNLIILDLAEGDSKPNDVGNYVAVRPSGTEPKIKFYLFAYRAAEQLADLQTAKRQLQERLDRFETDLRTFAGV